LNRETEGAVLEDCRALAEAARDLVRERFHSPGKVGFLERPDSGQQGRQIVLRIGRDQRREDSVEVRADVQVPGQGADAVGLGGGRPPSSGT
jgi:hypothetical protein